MRRYYKSTYIIELMRFLYIFPHPDDESFGSGPVISKQKREGHQVYLLTLTRGGATKQRFKYNYSIEEMGKIRHREMLNVANVLKLDGMNVLNLPDSGLKELDPREIELLVKKHIYLIQPEIIISYPVHGISGFHDHLVTHAIVKRVFIELKEKGKSFLKRLAFITVSEKVQKKYKDGIHRISYSTEDEIDCIIKVSDADIKKMQQALNCYITYQDVIKQTGIVEKTGKEVCFEIFKESFEPPLSDLTQKLRNP